MTKTLLIMNLIDKIRKSFKFERVLYSGHARYEMQAEEFGQILDQEVYEAINNGTIIKKYPMINHIQCKFYHTDNMT